MTMFTTTLLSHGKVETSPREIYGSGPVLLRIGNGGAGATGLVKIIAEDYLRTLEQPASIEWICNHSRNTQLALLHGHIDIALTYERDQEDLAESEGWSKTAGCVFHDHFCLAGPIEDPACIATTSSLEDALRAIASTKSSFHSRVDASATMWKERSLWSRAGLQPWTDDNMLGNWYHTNTLDPSGALMAADVAKAYLLSDRATLLTQTCLQTIHNSTVFFEPYAADSVLMNSCYALTSPNSSPGPARVCSNFLQYLFSDRGQNTIATMRRNEANSFPLFTPVAENFAQTFLKGGRPRGGSWCVPSN